MDVIVAVTGASGTVIAKRVLEGLKSQKKHLIMTDPARQVAKLEGIDPCELEELADKVHDPTDMTSPLASSSGKWRSMAIVPATMRSMASIANGLTDDLVTRAADNVLRLGGCLAIAPRETPFSLSAIENMRSLKLAGAHIVPPVMAYYYKPETLDDATCFFAGKVLDCLKIDHQLYARWEGVE